MKFQLSILVVAIIATSTFAQKIPSLTTDDVIASSPMPTPIAKKAEDSPSGDKKIADEKVKSSDKKSEVNPAEKEWNTHLNEAKEKSAELERRADQVEIEITQLRNQLTSAQSKRPEEVNQQNAKIVQLRKQADQLRVEAKNALQVLNKLETEGAANTFKVAEPKLVNEKGEPDPSAVEAHREKLQQEIKDAETRIELLQLQLTKIHSETSRNADRFALNRLNEQKEQTLVEIQKMKEKIASTTKDVGKLQ